MRNWHPNETLLTNEEEITKLEALDPDVLVSDLELTSEEILDAFPEKVAEYIQEKENE